MEIDFRRNLDELKEFLEEIGEDPRDYTEKELKHLLEEGF